MQLANQGRTSCGDGAAAPLSDILRRAAAYIGPAAGAAIAQELHELADAIDGGCPPDMHRLGVLFASDGPLHTTSLNDGWDEEYVGLAAAFRVESAGLSSPDHRAEPFT